jgi:hypothetical protein
MASDGMIYIPRYMPNGTGVQKLLREGSLPDTDGQQGDLLSLLICYGSKESRI